jgi:PAS domain S-box-containing protein
MEYNLNQNIEALREREAIQHVMFENLSDVIAIIDQVGVIKFISPNIEKWYGWKPEDVLDKLAFENLHPDDQERVQSYFGELLENPNGSGSEECQYKCKDLAYKWIEFTAVNLLKDPIINGILITYHDISARKLSELALHQSEEAYKRVINNVDEIFYSISFDDKNQLRSVDFVSDRIQHILGYTPAEIIQNPQMWLSIIHPDDFEDFEYKRFKTGIYRIKHKLTGEYVWIEDHPQSIVDENGKITGQYGTAHDITQRKQIQEKLSESQARLNRAELASKAGNWEFHLDSNKMIASEGAAKVYGVTMELDDFEYIRNIPLPEYRPMLTLALKNLIEKNEPYNVEFKIKAVDSGEIKDIHSVASFDRRKRILFGIIQDISDRKRTEEALRVSEQQLRGIFNNIQDAFFQADLSGTLTMVSPSAISMYGYNSAGELLGRPTRMLYGDPLVRKYLVARLHKLGQIEDYIGFGRKKDGSLFWASMNLQFVRNSAGQIIGTMGVVRDISERKRDEELLVESNELNNSLLNTIPFGMDIVDEKGNILFMSDNLKKLTNVDPVGQKCWDIYRDDKTQCSTCPLLTGIHIGKTDLYETSKIHGGKTFQISHTGMMFQGKKAMLEIFQDITEKKEIERKVKLLAHSLESISECVSVRNNDDQIFYVNESFLKTYGYTESELIGKNYDILLPAKEDMQVLNVVPKTTEGGWRGEIINKRKDDSLFPILLSSSGINDENGKPVATIDVAIDITEMRKRREELVVAKEHAEEINRLKSALLNNLSHEIRTPMNAIMGFSDLMKEADSDEKNRYAEIISNSSVQLLSMIDDVILLSRLQSEKLPLDKTEFRPAELVSEIRMAFDHPIMNKGLEIRENIPMHLKYLTLRADVKKIRQVIINFVSNSLKYTAEGYIELGFELKEGSVEFFVRDTGMGITEKEKELIFDVFYRSEQALSSAIRGTGLGLNIAKELIDLMGGNIWVLSESGKGSTFYFTVPVDQSEQLRLEEPPKLTFNQGLNNLNILIVDDEHFNIQYLEILFKDKVKKVDYALNGKEAVEMAFQNNYDLILMDLKMPIMDGIEATRILKEKYPEILIIAQTACAFPEEKDSAMLAGCDDFIVKPINKEKMMKVINKYV